MKQSNPRIRFEKFSNKWDNYKLGQLGSFKSGIGFPDSQQGGTEGIPFFKVSDMNNIGNETEMRNANNYVTQEQIAKNSWNVVKDTPAIIFAKVGAALMLNRKRLVTKTFLIDNNTMSYSLNKSWDKDFGLTLFQTIYLPKYAQIGALPSYNASDIATIKVNVPNIQEQTAIGSLFRTLDDLLASYKDNLTNYQSLKTTMLSKMFPKAGQRVPEIRLDGFEGEWEIVKLGDNCRIITGGTPRTGVKEFWNPKEIPWMSSGEINKKILNETEEMISCIGLENSSAKWVKQNSVLIALAGQGQTRGRVAINKIPLTTNQSIAAIETNSNIDFLFLYTDLGRRYDELRLISSGDGTRGGLNKMIISRLELNIPSIEEQQAIGAYFSNLDNLINSHQEKISQLGTLKKKLLQDMFI
ncbi:restriction endonuclease subunit S [Streptococcus mitis]|uniref:restriction endonuclease subunit S n=1 Tax=Streptococcus mitis TaxID=28037 RepID=UPI00066E6D9B